MIRICAIVAGWFVAAALGAVEVRFVTSDPRADDLITWELEAPDPAWFTSGTGPVLELTGPDGRTWKRMAFPWCAYVRVHTGDQRDPGQPVGAVAWRFRHTARQTGVVHWRLLDPAGACVASGGQSVGPARGPCGPIRVAANPRLLAFADGTPFIPIGPNLAWAVGEEPLAQFDAWFTALSAAGGTHCRVWLASWCGQILGDQATDDWRLDQAWLIDQVLALARQHRLHVTLVVDNHTDFASGHGAPYGNDHLGRLKAFGNGRIPEAYERKMRQIFARWGADDTILAWEVMNEIDLAAGKDHRFAAFWANKLMEHWAAMDQDRRLMTVSWSGGGASAAMSGPVATLAQLHCYVEPAARRAAIGAEADRDFLGILMHVSAPLLALGKPLLLSEVGYQGTGADNPGNEADTEGFLLTQTAWAGLMLGGCGSGMNWWWDGYIHPRDLWRCYTGMARIAGRVDWRDAEFRPFISDGESLRVLGWRSPRQALLWPVLRDDTWHRAVALRLPRPVLAQETLVTLEGFAPGVHLRCRRLAMADGTEQTDDAIQADAAGTLRVRLPAGFRDAVVWLKSE